MIEPRGPADASQDEEAGDDLLDRFRRYQATSNRALRNQLVEEHRHLAERFARRYSSRGLDVDDLRQTALLSMVRAVDRFDPDQGVTFATFASRTMDGELKRALRDKAWTVRPPRAAQERHLALRRREEELTHQLGRSPTVAELAAALDASVDEVLEAIEAGGARTAGAITRTDDDGESVDAGDLLAVRDRGFGRVDDRLFVAGLLDELDPRDREIVELRFFDRLGQDEIAERVGVSQSYLSRLLRRILLDLREKAEQRGSELDEPTI